MIGTTKRGIGPAYEDKVGRRAIRVMDLVNLKTLPAKLDRVLAHHNALRRGLGQPEIDRNELFEQLAAVFRRALRPTSTRSGSFLTAISGKESAFSLKERKARFSISITALIRS